ADGAVPLVGAGRGNRVEHDHRQRRPQRHVHPQRFRNAAVTEQQEQHRHQDGATADPKQPRQHASGRPAQEIKDQVLQHVTPSPFSTKRFMLLHRRQPFKHPMQACRKLNVADRRLVMMQAEFPHEPGLIYLNHAGVAPLPRRAAEAVRAFAAEAATRGARNYPRWLAVEASLRQRLARLLGTPSSDDIALVKNTSEGLSMVAYGLDWQPGDAVIINNHEFPSNRIVWESLAQRFGVDVRDVDLDAAPTPEDALIDALDARARLLAVSSVQFGSGLRMDLVRLAQACRSNGTLLCVDAIQSLGALRLDVASLQADFVIADGHKWMLGPEGLGVFYSRPEARERLKLTQYGWHMVEQAGDFDRRAWEVASSARRFECGSPNMLGIHALEASLALLEEVGLAE